MKRTSGTRPLLRQVPARKSSRLGRARSTAVPEPSPGDVPSTSAVSRGSRRDSRASQGPIGARDERRATPNNTGRESQGTCAPRDESLPPSHSQGDGTRRVNLRLRLFPQPEVPVDPASPGRVNNELHVNKSTEAEGDHLPDSSCRREVVSGARDPTTELTTVVAFGPGDKENVPPKSPQLPVVPPLPVTVPVDTAPLAAAGPSSPQPAVPAASEAGACMMPIGIVKWISSFLTYLEASDLDRRVGFKVTSISDLSCEDVNHMLDTSSPLPSGAGAHDVAQQTITRNEPRRVRWSTAIAEKLLGVSLGQCPEILRDLLNLSCPLCINSPYKDESGQCIANRWHALQCPCIAMFVYMFPSQRPKGLMLASRLNGSIIAHGFSAVVNGLTSADAYTSFVALGVSGEASNVEPCDLLVPIMNYFLHPDSTKRGDSPTSFALNVAEACGRRWNATGDAIEAATLHEHLTSVLGVPVQEQVLHVKLQDALTTWRVTRNNCVLEMWKKICDPSNPMHYIGASQLGTSRFDATSPWYGSFHRLGGRAENLPLTCDVFWFLYDRVFGSQSVEESVRLSLISFLMGSMLGQFVNTADSRPLNFAMTSGNHPLGSSQRSKVQRKKDLSARLQMLLAADLSRNSASREGAAPAGEVPVACLPFIQSWTVKVGPEGQGQEKKVIYNDIPEHQWGKSMQAVAALGPEVFAPARGTVPVSRLAARCDAPV